MPHWLECYVMWIVNGRRRCGVLSVECGLWTHLIIRLRGRSASWQRATATWPARMTTYLPGRNPLRDRNRARCDDSALYDVWHTHFHTVMENLHMESYTHRFLFGDVLTFFDHTHIISLHGELRWAMFYESRNECTSIAHSNTDVRWLHSTPIIAGELRTKW